ncbi:enhancer of mRNA-decapping protein 3-like [Ischnura elegans]|uniref:enhancer of mRNA-decapping protein 3-like n=1 Tax=Ischnura elegans TaxID=197161 RepID=UPI001ED86AD5|nr:enhancer of mRNA-decapping protein 3-like [Ischnura elegans]
MRALAIIFAIVGVCSAATFVAMNEDDLEKVMMGQMYAQDPSHPFMGVGTLMATQRQQKEQDPTVAEAGEPIGQRDARDADEAHEEPQADAPANAPRQSYMPYNMFGNGGFMGMMIPDMFAGQQQGNGYRHEPAGNGHAAASDNGYAASPYASKPAGNGHAVANGNGYKRPANGNSRPNGNGHARPNGNGNGNGKRGGSASAASAGSFNKGSGSFSQAQAFSGSF